MNPIWIALILFFSLLLLGLIAVGIQRRPKRKRLSTPIQPPTEQATVPDPTGATTIPAIVTPPPRPVATPAGKQVPWLGLAVLALIVLTVAIFGLKGLYSLKVESDRLEAVRVEPRWGDISVLYLTSTPTVVPWPEGAIQFKANLSPAEERTRHFILKSDGKKFSLGYEGSNFEVTKGKPLELSSADKREVAITLQWRK